MNAEEFPPPRHVDWNEVKKTLFWALLCAALATGVDAYFFWGFPGLLAEEGALLCLALGFWITERLIAVFTQTRKASPTAILLLFSGKLAWWATLFAVARHLPSGLDRAIALGIVSFLAALLVAMLRHYGMQRNSDGNPPASP